jgi:diguanylate cyclase (GGDEF)-like protein
MPTPLQVETAIGNHWLWGMALVLAILAWWAAMRRSHQLDEETHRLTREQRRLKSAHTNLQQKSEQLERLSIHDPLTGTFNRTAFAAELRDRIEHLASFHRPLNLIVFDLDHFKDINDRHGHLTGDIALKLVVGVVREHLVSDDLFGRFGGDEFLIACADQTLEATGKLAEIIRAAVESRAQSQRPPIPLLTLSIGVAQANAECGYQPDELFSRADAALYEAKRRGRNNVVLADAELATSMAAADASHRHL